ncbi:MAG TPA: undecaprenyl-diphosphate phosphatase [Candidatus Limnocylindrales bacterium]|nr:undecaprenyl-diphosphate phosphatase [Candidatus Limnocylindrales bacterium]
MDLTLQAIVLGIVQGLTEFLPVSSSAHLIVLPQWLGWDDPFLNSNAFDVMLHLGTLLALVAYFWRDLWRYLRAWLASLAERRIGGDADRRLAWLLIITVIPGALLGAGGESFFDTFFRQRSSIYIAILLCIGAAFLWLGERQGDRSRGMEGLGVRDAILIGLAQALALFPGMSRSGTTIGAGLLLGLEREAAARFSFLMSAPIIAGAVVLKGKDLVVAGVPTDELLPLLAGMAAAVFFGLLAVTSLLAWLRRRSTDVFIAYRVLLAAAIVVVVLSR